MRKLATENGWMIAGRFGLYTGWWFTRREAIEAHVAGKVICGCRGDPVKAIWKNCQKEGDYAVRVQMKYEEK